MLPGAFPTERQLLRGARLGHLPPVSPPSRPRRLVARLLHGDLLVAQLELVEDLAALFAL